MIDKIFKWLGWRKPKRKVAIVTTGSFTGPMVEVFDVASGEVISRTPMRMGPGDATVVDVPAGCQFRVVMVTGPATSTIAAGVAK